MPAPAGLRAGAHRPHRRLASRGNAPPSATAQVGQASSTAVPLGTLPVARPARTPTPSPLGATGSSPPRVVAPSATPIATRLVIANVQWNPGDVVVTFVNMDSATATLGDWVLQAGTASASIPSGLQVAPGGTLVLHFGAGTSAGRDVYLGPAAEALMGQLQPGVSLMLLDPAGDKIQEFSLPGG